MPKKISIHISPIRTAFILSCIVAFLTLMHILVIIISPYALKFPSLEGVIFLWSLDLDGNIPTWYASSTLLICFLLLAIISVIKKRTGDYYFRYWTGLSLIFLCLSIDETATIHERIGDQIEVRLNTSGFLHWPWVIFGAAFVFIVLLVYLKFLFRLPAKTRFLFIIAGIIYVGGALGIEMINANLADIYNNTGNYGRSLIFEITTTIEEFCEMLGVIVFIYALISYLMLYVQEIKICLVNSTKSKSRLNT